MSEVTSVAEDKARKIVVEYLGVDAEKVTSDASFTDDLGADSLDRVEILMEFEESFDIAITDDEGAKVDTFGQAVELVIAKLA